MSNKLHFRLVVLVAAMMCALGASAQEAYAWYSPGANSLTFCYDNERSICVGTTYDLNDGTIEPGWITDGNSAYVKYVSFHHSFADYRPTSTYHWFYEMRNLESITGMRYLNTSEVTRMDNMFHACYKLTSIDLSNFNTTNVTSMSGMFSRCSGMTVLDLSSFNTANVTSMEYMFNACTNLTTIYVGTEWSTAAVTKSTDMFYNCTSLFGGKGTPYDADHVDKTYARLDGKDGLPGYLSDIVPGPYACFTTADKTLTFYFDNQRNTRPGKTYDLNEGKNNSGWRDDGTNDKVSKVVFDPSFAEARPTSTYGWFYGMQWMKSIEGLEYLNTSEVTFMNYMFYDCSDLTSIDLSHFNTDKVIHMPGLFSYCQKLTSLDLSTFNTAKVETMDYMFSMCVNLQTIYVGSGWSTAAVDDTEDVFYGCIDLVGGKGTTYTRDHIGSEYAHIDGGESNPGYLSDINPAPYACYTAEDATLTFYYDNRRGPRPGKTYDLNTDNNETAWRADGASASVTKVVFDPSFAEARPTTTYGWFDNMKLLRPIEGMENLNTSEVTSMKHMFYNCNELRSLDLSHFNTAKVTDMSGMFALCVYLTSLDLSTFNTANVEAMDSMFHACISLQTIYVGDGWSTAAVTESGKMFNDCIDLAGDKGTSYDNNHIDKEYAHIDGGASDPGYMSYVAPQAYACYTAENTTLTFYYDYYRTGRTGTTGTTYVLNASAVEPCWATDGTNAKVTQVAFDPSFAEVRPMFTCYWFYEMRKLESITGLNYLNTSEVTRMDAMFSRCYKLTSLDLSNFNTSNVTDLTEMFRGSAALRTIYVGDGWQLRDMAQAISRNVFNDCTSLVGGQGTAYDPAHVGGDYAHIDGGPSNPGYFTDKNASQRGDVDGDGTVNIADVTALIDYLLSGSASGVNLTAADCNQDSSVNISDVTSLIDYLLSGTWN